LINNTFANFGASLILTVSPLDDIEERSSGAIVIRVGAAERNYLLQKYPAGHWDFPKGNVEPGEGDVQTAAREVNEETGIEQLIFLPEFRKTIEYFYRRKGKHVHKEVIFLLAQTHKETVRLSHEHLDFGWFDFKGAIGRLTYANSKKVLTLAEKYLTGAGSQSIEAGGSGSGLSWQGRSIRALTFLQ
jgi:8-oxo-dGTP pyrophosphatase MutT (NUDIX family)